MSKTFRAILISKSEGEAGAKPTQSVALTELDSSDLMPGDVTVQVHHSSLNYKDGLALTGQAPVVRHWPMVPGIDLAGTVVESASPQVAMGSRVVVNGWGLGETHWGGYGELARLKAEWLVPLPDAFSTEEAMAIGTAGYTSMLCVMALEDHAVTPKSGPVLVTGAAGGVGSVAVALLAKLGFEVAAVTGRPEEEGYLKSLGASDILPRADFEGAPRALAKEKWAGVVDAVGSNVLANAISQTRYGGAVAACGLAAGMDLPTSVAPFILRGVNLLGIDSVYAPPARRIAAWERLARDLDPALLRAMTQVVDLERAMALGSDILAGRVRGRTVVRVTDAS